MRDPLRREIRRGETAESESDISRMGEKPGEMRIGTTATNSEGKRKRPRG